MRWLEVRRHSLTKKGNAQGGGSHLSVQGVALARTDQADPVGLKLATSNRSGHRRPRHWFMAAARGTQNAAIGRDHGGPRPIPSEDPGAPFSGELDSLISTGLATS
jgi:hypothetical protein